MRRRFLFVVFIVMILQATPFTAAQTINWESRFNHILKIAFTLPQGYELAPEFLHQYTDGSSSIRFWWADDLPPYDGAAPLEDHCAAFPWAYRSMEVIRRAAPPVCLMHAQDGYTYALVLAERERFTSRGQAYTSILIWTGDSTLIPIAESLEFVDSVSAPRYLDEALRIIASNYVYREQLDWEALYRGALASVDENSTLEDAHRALQDVLAATAGIGAHRGRLLLPSGSGSSRQSLGFLLRYIDTLPVIDMVYPNSPAEAAGLRVGDVLERVNDSDPATAMQGGFSGTVRVRVRRGDTPLDLDLTPTAYDTFLPPVGRRLDGNIGYLETFTLDTSAGRSLSSRYATFAQNLIREIDSTAVCGWIIDVRRNRGGQIAGMSAALGPLIGDGGWFTDRLADGTLSQGEYQAGKWLSSLDGTLTNTETLVEQPYTVQRPHPPVAVLVSAETTSMGEMTAFLFRERTQGATRVFGERTRGLMGDGIIDFPLADRAILRVVDRVLLDTEGQPAPHAVEPDVVMVTDYARYGTDDDTLLAAARAWLLQRAEC